MGSKLVKLKPHIYYRDGYWCVDTGNVCGWGLGSCWDLAYRFVNARNAYADVPW